MAVEKNIKINVDAKDGIKQVDKLKKGVKDTSTAAAGTKGAFGKMKAGVQGLGVAFKALGIGLIVAAFVKLKDIFSGNIETARRFERVSAQLGAAFDVIRDRAENFIKALIKMKNPLKAFKEAFTGTREEIKEETKAMDSLTLALQKVRDEERDMILERAKANRIIAESRLLAEDETKTIKERLVGLKRAVAEEKRVAQLELDTQQKKVDALQAIIDLGKSSEEYMIELANERARLIDLETSSTQRQLRVTRELNTMERELAAENKKNGETIITIKKKQLTQSEINVDKEIQLNKKRTTSAKKTSDDLIKIEQLTQDQKTAIISGALGNLSSALGENSKAAKAIAIAQALMDTYAGANKALAQGGIFGFVSAAGIVVAGLANVAKIKSTNPETGAGGSDDASVPDSSPSGLIGNLIPNMSAITPPELGEPAPVQAYVVENDISNAQALQDQLEIQSTL